MKAAGLARKWWARRRLGWSAATPTPGRTTARVTTFLLLLLALAAVVCAGIGLTVTQRNDSRQESERHVALQTALDEFHAVFGEVDHFDSAQIGLIERRAGLRDLRFDTDPTADSGREVQSLHDAQGRIVGWVSWGPGRGVFFAVDSLWGGAAALAALLAMCAFLALRATRRLSGSLARSIVSIRKLITQDALT